MVHCFDTANRIAEYAEYAEIGPSKLAVNHKTQNNTYVLLNVILLSSVLDKDSSFREQY